MNEIVSTVILTLELMSPVVLLDLICCYVARKERRG